MNFDMSWATSLERASIQGGFVLFLAFILCRALPFLSPRVKCWIWRVAWVKTVIALVWGTTINLPILPASPLIVPVSTGQSSVPASLSESVSQETESPIVIESSARRSAIEKRRFAISPLMLVWMAGAAFFLIRLLHSWKCVRTLCRAAVQSSDAVVDSVVTNLCERFRIRCPAVLISPTTSQPFVTGIIRPVVVLPIAIHANMSQSQFEMILAHEFAHLKRGDLAWNSLSLLARMLLWFHPVMWFAAKESRLAQEMAADELAIKKINRAPADYAGMLIDFISRNARAKNAPELVAVGILNSKSSLQRRVMAMKYWNKKTNKIAALATSLLLLVSSAALLPWRVVAKTAEPEENANNSRRSENRLNQTEEKRHRLKERIELASRELALIKGAKEAGNGSSEDLINKQREILRLKHQLALLDGNLFEKRATLERELELIKILLEKQREKVEAGSGDPDAARKLESEAATIEREVRDAGTPETQRLENQLEHLREKEKDLMSIYTEASKPVQQVREQIAGLERHLKNYYQAAVPDTDAESADAERERSLNHQISRLQKEETEANETSPDKRQLDLIHEQLAYFQRRLEEIQENHRSSIIGQPVRLVSRRTGIVLQVNAREGEHVKGGQQLLRIDSDEAEGKMRIAEAQVKLAVNAMQVKQTENEEAQKERAKIEKLISEGTVSSSEFKSAEKAKNELARAQIECQIAETQLQEAKAELDRYVIRAPQDGTVTKILVSKGEAVATALTQPVIEIMPDSVEDTVAAKPVRVEVADGKYVLEGKSYTLEGIKKILTNEKERFVSRGLYIHAAKEMESKSVWALIDVAREIGIVRLEVATTPPRENQRSR